MTTGFYYMDTRLVQFSKINQFNPPYSQAKEEKLLIQTQHLTKFKILRVLTIKTLRKIRGNFLNLSKTFTKNLWLALYQKTESFPQRSRSRQRYLLFP